MKMMKINPARLLQLLAAAGYERGFSTGAVPSFSLIRPSAVAGLYESIVVDAGGREAEAVAAEVGVSVTKVVMYKRMGAVRLINEVAENAERGQTIIRSKEKAIEWEQRLAAIAPDLSSAWAESEGPAILASNQEVRSIADAYAKQLDSKMPCSKLLEHLRSIASQHSVEVAENIFNSGGRGPRGTEDAYALACVAIVHFVGVVEPHRASLVSANPLCDPDLQDRIHQVADRFLACDRQI
jgi:hypothetical protein